MLIDLLQLRLCHGVRWFTFIVNIEKDHSLGQILSWCCCSAGNATVLPASFNSPWELLLPCES